MVCLSVCLCQKSVKKSRCNKSIKVSALIYTEYTNGFYNRKRTINNSILFQVVEDSNILNNSYLKYYNN